jgi:hypothetical protein
LARLLHVLGESGKRLSAGDVAVVSRLWSWLSGEHRQVIAWCVLLNIWFVVTTTPAMTRLLTWLSLAVPPDLAAH